MTNQYISEGILQDAYNDHEIVREIRNGLHELSAMCNKFEYDGSMAYNRELTEKVNDSITHILNAHVEPIEEQINEAIRHFENDSKRIQGAQAQDGRIPTPTS